MSRTPVADTISNKDKAAALLKSIETRDSGSFAYLHPTKYIQHNLAIADGLQGFAALLKQDTKDAIRVRPLRVFEDGNYVFTHSDYNHLGPKTGFDIFRFEEDIVVEHWDNLQEAALANRCGHTMLDGPVEARDPDRKEANKALARSFVTEILVNGRLSRAPRYFNGDRCIQHNPQIDDGLSGLLRAFEEMAQRGVAMKYDQIHRVLGEGDFVLVSSEGLLAGKHTSFYDLFRMEEDSIAEHWDTIETIRPEDHRKHKNGKF